MKVIRQTSDVLETLEEKFYLQHADREELICSIRHLNLCSCALMQTRTAAEPAVDWTKGCHWRNYWPGTPRPDKKAVMARKFQCFYRRPGTQLPWCWMRRYLTLMPAATDETRSCQHFCHRPLTIQRSLLLQMRNRPEIWCCWHRSNISCGATDQKNKL